MHAAQQRASQQEAYWNFLPFLQFAPLHTPLMPIHTPLYQDLVKQQIFLNNLFANISPVNSSQQLILSDNTMLGSNHPNAVKAEFDSVPHEKECKVQVKIEASPCRYVDLGPTTKRVRNRNRITKPRYEKNICGYILKKVFRAFLSPIYRDEVIKSCEFYKVGFEEVSKICYQKMEKINGISRLDLVLYPKTTAGVRSMLTLTRFAQWFLDERYLRHLISEGKMNNKKTYITFKNRFFPAEIKRLRAKIDELVKQQEVLNDK